MKYSQKESGGGSGVGKINNYVPPQKEKEKEKEIKIEEEEQVITIPSNNSVTEVLQE